MRFTVILASAILASLVVAVPARGESHSYINLYRSSVENNVFFSQSVQGEFNRLSSDDAKDSAEVDPASPTSEDGATKVFRGYALKTSLGVEMRKFVRFSLSHALVDLKDRDDGLSSLRGSRISGNFGLVFQGPLVNVEVGGGADGGRYDFQKDEIRAGMVSSGYHASLGIEHFVTSRVSIVSQMLMESERLVRDSGADDDRVPSGCLLEGRAISFGLYLWF